MNPDRGIVVGICATEAAGRTLAWALREAATTGAHLTVVRADVPRDELVRAAPRGSVAALEVLEPALARAVAAARLTLGEHRVSIVVERGAAGEVLADVAARDDLVVVGPPARPGWWARASTTYRLATRARCPVVVVHRQSSGPAEGIGQALRSHVIAGVDGSAAAREALGFGFAFAADHQLPIAAIAASAHPDNDVWFDDRMLETHLGTEPEEAAMLAAEVEPWELKFPGVAVKRALVAGRPAEALRRAAAGAALLVVGSSGGGLAPLGSVCRTLIESSPCPIAIVSAAR